MLGTMQPITSHKISSRAEGSVGWGMAQGYIK
jgi:hypothetical protein